MKRKFISLLVIAGLLLGAIPIAATGPLSYERLYPYAEPARELIKDSVALYVGSHKAAVNGERTVVNPQNSEITPILLDGVTMVPVRFIAESLGGTVGFDGENKTVTINISGTRVVLTYDSDQMIINGSPVSMDKPLTIINDTSFVPARNMGEAVGYHVFWHEVGLVVLSEEEKTIDEDMARHIVYYIIYERPTAEQILADFNETNMQRPRLMANADRFEQVKDNLKTDATVQKFYEQTSRMADTLLATPVPKVSPATSNWGYGRNTTNNIFTLGMMYKLTDDEKYAERAVQEIIWACNMGNWNPSHYLDVGEMALGIGVGYDWFYDYMTECERSAVVEAIVKHALKPTMEHYIADAPGARFTSDYNWNSVCNGGVAVAAIAILDSEQYGNLAAQTVQYALRGLEYMIAEYYPDGGWHEGLTYWEYAYDFHVYFAAALDATFDTEYGIYYDVPGVKNTVYFMPYLQGPGGIFNIHDAGNVRVLPSTTMWHASKLGDARFNDIYLTQMEMIGKDLPAKDISRALLWFAPELTNSGEEPPLDAYFRGVEVASFRTAWDDANATFVTLHGGLNNCTHGQLDSGTFILDANGERWAHDVGKEDYNLPGFWGGSEGSARWTYYSNRAEAHNTVVINPGHSADQRADGFPKLLSYESKEKGAYSIIDMTSSHAPNVTDAKRGMMLTEDRSLIVVQDEIKTHMNVDFWWFMHTKADIEISSDRKTATLNQNGKQLVVQILSPSPADAVFREMEAVPLQTSPQPDGTMDLSDYKKLAIYLRQTGDVNIAVGMRPLGYGEEITKPFPEMQPLSAWSIPDGKISSSAIYPKLNQITINGEPMEGFSPNSYTYNARFTEGDGEINFEGKADSKNEVEVSDDGKGRVEIIVTDKKSKLKTIYLVTYNIMPATGKPDGMVEYFFDDVVASAEPQAENAAINVIDGNLNTRWSAEGQGQWINLTFTETRYLGAVSVAFLNGNARRAFYDVEVSADGNNWKTVFSGESSGLTVEDERIEFPMQYVKSVRITCNGTATTGTVPTGMWNSVTMVRAFGE